MIKYIGLILGGIFLFYSEVYVWSKFYDKKIDFKNPWLYFSIFTLTLLSIYNHLYVNAFIKMLSITFLMCICNWLIFKRKINEIFISVIYGQLLATLADGISVILLVLVFEKDTNFVKNNLFDTFMANVLVSLIYLGISKIPFVKKIYTKFIDLTNKIKTKYFILGCLLIIMSINFLAAIIYYDMKSIYVIIINCILLLIYSYIVYKAMNEKNINIMMKAENNSLMKSLNEYESMVDRQRVDNHENKNQLLIIKNMIKKNDKDVVKYIDTIVKDEKEDDEALYTKVKTIPTGGLQGIIYQKMLTMKDNKILFSLDVSRDVRKINLDNFSMENNYKLCKIIGVLLDNAIEESLEIEDKRIMISLYEDENMLIIEICNRFNGNVEVDKLDDEGFTTKGEGNGTGLGLAICYKIIEKHNGKILVNSEVGKGSEFIITIQSE